MSKSVLSCIRKVKAEEHDTLHLHVIFPQSPYRTVGSTTEWWFSTFLERSSVTRKEPVAVSVPTHSSGVRGTGLRAVCSQAPAPRAENLLPPKSLLQEPLEPVPVMHCLALRDQR